VMVDVVVGFVILFVTVADSVEVNMVAVVDGTEV